jgi:mannose-6-phosphate isomerase-like protein (cupin superfamily)
MTEIETPWNGVTVTWLADAVTSGALRGCSALLTLAPGAVCEPRRLEHVETVVYVCRGEVIHTGAGGEILLEADDTLTVPEGRAHGLVNRTNAPAGVLVSYTGTTTLPWDQTTVAPDEPSPHTDVFVRRLHGVSDDPSASLERGFRQMEVSFAAAEGARMTTFGSGRWPTGAGQHMWHRHPHADEVIYIYGGYAAHMTESGSALLGQGGLAYVPAGLWHTMRSSDPGQPLDAVFGYLGGATLEEAGYELRDAATPRRRRRASDAG